MWSVGSSPLVDMSHDSQFSQINLDVVHRNYLTSTIRTVTEELNQAVAKLTELKTNSANEGASSQNYLWQHKQHLFAQRSGTAGLSRSGADRDLWVDLPGDKYSMDVEVMMLLYTNVKTEVTSAVHAISDFQFADTDERIHKMLSTSSLLSQAVAVLANQSVQSECSHAHSTHGIGSGVVTKVERISVLWYVFGASACLFGCLYKLLWQNAPKTKFN